jgi:hypothetical protein
MNAKRKAPPRAYVFFLIDLIALLIALLAIANAAFPQSREIIQNALATPTPTATPVPATPTPLAETPVPTPTMSPTPTPSPTPAPGDFSASFATADIAEGMDYVYRNDGYIIGIEEYYVEDAVLFVADIYIRDIHLLKTAFAHNMFKGDKLKYDYILDLNAETNAAFSVSGDFVAIREDGLIIRNGELLQSRKFTDLCVLYIDGTMAVYGAQDISPEELAEGGVWQTWCFGPNLLGEGGQAIEISHKLMHENPRCAIGYFEPGHYCFVVVDGRQKYYSDGMTLTELSAFLSELGCKTAYNLDGGQSAQMVLEDNVVNMPANGGRRVGDIIYLERTEPNP